MNPTLLRVTQRIIERSKETRSAYLARIEQAKTNTVHRSQLACGNLAHGFAACQPEDKASLKSMLRNNIAIITSYNDMLSAHQPYEVYPDIIRKALHSVNAVGGGGGVPAMCDGVTQGAGRDGAVAAEPRSHCHVCSGRSVTICLMARCTSACATRLSRGSPWRRCRLVIFRPFLCRQVRWPAVCQTKKSAYPPAVCRR